MPENISRRRFIQASAIASAGIVAAGRTRAQEKPKTLSPNDKVNVAIVGVANRGADNLAGVRHHNIVALCDVDDNYLGAAAKQFPEAKIYNDYRRMLEQKGIDAVVVSTPD